MMRTRLVLACLLIAAVNPAQALVFNLGNSPIRQLHLQVGSGGSGANIMATNPTIDTVSVVVPAASVGSGVAQVMATSNPDTIDPYPPVHLQCNDGKKVLISAIARVPIGVSTAVLTVNSSNPLLNGSGNALPFSQISWVSSDASIPSGSFTNSASQTLLTMSTSQQYESCHTFSYGNVGMVPAGSYTGQVIYTLSMP